MTYRNLAEMHRRQAERWGPRPALRYKRHGVYHDVSSEQYRADALACAAALISAGIQPGDRVGLLSENRVEWLIADMGILAAAAVNVPPHAPLSARQIHFQLADGDRVTTYKTYYGTHQGPFLGIAPTHRKIHFETVDVMRVQNGKITDHWGVGNLLSLMQQIGGWTPSASEAISRDA